MKARSGMCAAAAGAFDSAIPPLSGERWWGGVPNDGDGETFPCVPTSRPTACPTSNGRADLGGPK